MPSNFDDIFSAVGKKSETPPPTKETKTKAKPKTPKAKTEASPKYQVDPWGDIETPEKQATVRLNVDISVAINEKLAAKAREKGVPKTELVRKLLEWALE
jgi:hypothetical protein